jgi:hypothetical protein
MRSGVALRVRIQGLRDKRDNTRSKRQTLAWPNGSLHTCYYISPWITLARAVWTMPGTSRQNMIGRLRLVLDKTIVQAHEETTWLDIKLPNRDGRLGPM